MSSTHKATRIFVYLLAVTFVSFSIWLVLKGRSNYSQPPSTPTPKSEYILKYPPKTFWGNYIVASIEAPPGTPCKLIYMSPSGEMHEIETVTKDDGLCEGRWKIEQAEGKGTGRLNFRIGDFIETHFIEVRSSP